MVNVCAHMVPCDGLASCLERFPTSHPWCSWDRLQIDSEADQDEAFPEIEGVCS